VYGDVPINVDPTTLRGGKSATVEQLLAVGEEIAERAARSGVPRGDVAAGDKLYKEFRELYQDFAQEFPLVVSWAVTRREYSSKAFKIYLTKFHKPHYKTREQFLKTQAEYLVILYRLANRGIPEAALAGRRAAIRKALLKDDKKFMAASDEAEAEIKQREKDRRALILARAKEQLAALEPSARAEV